MMNFDLTNDESLLTNDGIISLKQPYVELDTDGKPTTELAQVRNNDGFCIKNEEFCIKNDEFCSSPGITTYPGNAA